MIKVLIAEDSHVMQELLIHTLSSDPDFQIIGVVKNGQEAVLAAARLRPDVIAMDWHMPKFNGLMATRSIMESNPIPIVIVTGSYVIRDEASSFKSIEAGALAIVKKPPAVDDPRYKTEAQELIRTLKLMSQVKLVKRIVRTEKKEETAKPITEKLIKAEAGIEVVVIGASTGGPMVLQNILSGLPADFPVPILIVQHISPGFVTGFVDWLRNTTNFPLHVALHGEPLIPGHGYVAPDNFHMGVEAGPRIVLSDKGVENGLRPSVSFLFRTAAQLYGSKAVGVLLTGMGRDGAEEMKLMRNRGAITIAQDKESSAVHGMPGEAIKLDAATYILSPIEITEVLKKLIIKTDRK